MTAPTQTAMRRAAIWATVIVAVATVVVRLGPHRTVEGSQDSVVPYLFGLLLLPGALVTWTHRGAASHIGIGSAIHSADPRWMWFEVPFFSWLFYFVLLYFVFRGFARLVTTIRTERSLN